MNRLVHSVQCFFVQLVETLITSRVYYDAVLAILHAISVVLLEHYLQWDLLHLLYSQVRMSFYLVPAKTLLGIKLKCLL